MLPPHCHSFIEPIGLTGYTLTYPTLLPVHVLISSELHV